MELFSTVAQLLPVFVAASLFLLPRLTARKTFWRWVIIGSGILAAFATAICVLVLGGTYDPATWNRVTVMVCALLSISLGGVGLFAGAIPTGPTPPSPAGGPAS